MRVAELINVRSFQIIDQPLEEPGPGQMRVRVTAVGLCGSDLHNYSEGGIGDIPAQFPMVLGHEPAGVIEKLGHGVTRWSIGDRVALEPAIYCYHCEFCQSGHHNVCKNVRFMSLPGDPGFFRDYVIVPEQNALALPEGLSLEQGTLVEPLGIALHSLSFADIHPGDTAAVFGAGPIGLLTVAALKTAGAGRVWSIDPVAHRRELARLVGADAVLDPAAVNPAHEILRDTGRRGVDVALDCAAKRGTMNYALDVTRNAGRVVLTGIPSEVMVELAFHVMRRKELALFNVRRSNHQSERALEMIHAEPRRFSQIQTHSRPIEKVGEAFDILEHYADGVGKMMVHFD